jgi:hypothetical protein
MDVSKDEQLLAVLEDSYTEVKIFHHGTTVQQKEASSNKTHEELKQQIAKRAQLLKENLVAALCESERELLKELSDSFNKMAVPMQKSRSCAEENLSTVHALQQEMKTAVNESSTTQLLSLSRNMASGQDSKQQLQQLMVHSSSEQYPDFLQVDILLLWVLL